MSILLKPSTAVPAGKTEYLQAIIDYTQKLHQHVQARALTDLATLPELDFASEAHIQLGPKYPGRDFAYENELKLDDGETPAAEERLLDEVARFFKGAIRPQSQNFLFNMVPEPNVEATAAAWLATVYNTNSLMDTFGGEALLIEQQVARRIGLWAGWSQAMGIACNGGKLTIMYAISRIEPDSQRKGLPGDLVILCSEGAHYCVEHAVSLLGLGADNCLRVPSNSEGSMRLEALRHMLDEQHKSGRRVAAIICCGGTTINFNCENTYEVSKITKEFALEYGIKQRPYLHLDSVIGWLYLSMFNADETKLNQHFPDHRSRMRVAEVLKRLRGINDFDSLGVDFHKDGLCPYASSFFIARDRRFMDELGDGSYQYDEKDFQFGQFRAYRYTFENSRPTQGILAAWASLIRFGRTGYADYLASLHDARNALSAAIELQSEFHVLNHSSLGWEVVFEAFFAPDLLAFGHSKQELAIGFMQECWALTNAGYDLPLFSIVPGYRINNDPEKVTTGFLLYPMQQQSDARWEETARLIAVQFKAFQARVRFHPDAINGTSFEKPIR